MSQFKRELLSPSVAVSFFLKLKARRKPAVDELPLETRGDWINAFALMLLLGGIWRDKSARQAFPAELAAAPEDSLLSAAPYIL